MKTQPLLAALILCASAYAVNGEPATQFLGPCPYLSFADSPFNGLTCSSFQLEDFEDGLLNVTGVVASAGAPTGPGGLTDSVDGDDGSIDGSGTAGRSLFFGSGSTGITFTFDANVLGALPTFAGIVWTDGEGTTSFEAFDENSQSLGTIGPVAIADGTVVGTTAEDRFFGVVHTGGISAIKISNTAGGIEVDHLQYGICEGAVPNGCPTNCVPALSGLVAWWPGDGNADDIAGTNDGDAQPTVEFPAGMVGPAFSFDGVGAFVAVPDDISLALTDAITIDAWIKPLTPGNANGTTFVMLKGDSQLEDTQSYGLVWANQAIFFRVANTSTLDQVSVDIPLDVYTHVAGTYDGTTMSLYTNGVLATSQTTLIGALQDTDAPIIIGSSLRNGSLQEFFHGLLDEIEIFDRALSAEEIVAIFNAGSAGKCKDLLPLSVDLGVTKVDLTDPVLVGSTFTYRITVANNGPDDATGVVLVDNLPPSVSFVSANPSQGSCTNVNGTVTCDLGDIANANTVIVTIQVTADAIGEPENTATVSGNEPDPNENNNTAIERTTITAGIHDFALISLKAPKNINLKGAEPSLTKRVKVQIQNRSPHDETINNLEELADLVHVNIESLGECTAPQAVLIAGPPNNVPRVLGPKKKLNVFFDVTFSCANNPSKGSPDFRYTAHVEHSALNGLADSHLADDDCPRAPLPGGADPVDGSKDKGCGNKDKATGQLGADVLTDVVQK